MSNINEYHNAPKGSQCIINTHKQHQLGPQKPDVIKHRLNTLFVVIFRIYNFFHIILVEVWKYFELALRNCYWPTTRLVF